MQQFDKCFICSILCSPSLLLRKLKLNACTLSCFSHVQLSATLQTSAHQAPLSMGFFRQKYWSGLPCPPPGDLPNTGIEPASLMSPASSYVSCIGRRVFYHYRHLGSPKGLVNWFQVLYLR